METRDEKKKRLEELQRAPVSDRGSGSGGSVCTSGTSPPVPSLRDEILSFAPRVCERVRREISETLESESRRDAFTRQHFIKLVRNLPLDQLSDEDILERLVKYAKLYSDFPIEFHVEIGVSEIVESTLLNAAMRAGFEPHPPPPPRSMSGLRARFDELVLAGLGCTRGDQVHELVMRHAAGEFEAALDYAEAFLMPEGERDRLAAEALYRKLFGSCVMPGESAAAPIQEDDGNPLDDLGRPTAGLGRV